jgi:hypothetical protein
MGLSDSRNRRGTTVNVEKKLVPASIPEENGERKNGERTTPKSLPTYSSSSSVSSSASTRFWTFT